MMRGTSTRPGEQKRKSKETKNTNKRRGATREGERREERERSEPARQGAGMGSTNPNLCVMTGSGVGFGPLNQFPPIGFTQPTRMLKPW